MPQIKVSSAQMAQCFGSFVILPESNMVYWKNPCLTVETNSSFHVVCSDHVKIAVMLLWLCEPLKQASHASIIFRYAILHAVAQGVATKDI